MKLTMKENTAKQPSTIEATIPSLASRLKRTAAIAKMKSTIAPARISPRTSLISCNCSATIFVIWELPMLLKEPLAKSLISPVRVPVKMKYPIMERSAPISFPNLEATARIENELLFIVVPPFYTLPPGLPLL